MKTHKETVWECNTIRNIRTPNPHLENQSITEMMGIIKKSYYICEKISDNHASTSSLFSAVHQVYQR